MTAPVTRLVRFFSSVHNGLVSIRTTPQGIGQRVGSTFFTPDRFPYFLGVLAVGSFTVGWKSVDWLRDEFVSHASVLPSAGQSTILSHFSFTHTAPFLFNRNGKTLNNTQLKSTGDDQIVTSLAGKPFMPFTDVL